MPPTAPRRPKGMGRLNLLLAVAVIALLTLALATRLGADFAGAGMNAWLARILPRVRRG